MSDKKFTLKPGGKLIIEINRAAEPKKQNFAGHLSPKGLIKTRREDEYLPRRLKKSSFIQFYDLGLFYNSEDGFAEADFQRESTYTLDSGLGVNRSHPTDAQHQELVDYVMSVGVENLETTYYRQGVDYSYFFRVFITCDDFFLETDPTAEHWSEEGLKLTDEQLSSANLTFQPSWTTAMPVKVKGTGKNKITASYDSGAPDVGFVPGKSDKYFFLPRLATPTASTLLNSPASNDSLISNHRVTPRLPFVFPDEPTFHLPPVQQWADDLGQIEFEKAKKLAALVNDAAFNIRVIRRTQVSPGVVETSSIDPASFPRADHFGASPSADAFSLEASFLATDDPPAGTLIAVIKQGSKFFYVWK